MQPLPADSEVISADLHCVRCGYNLRGLSRSGRCPECNTPIPRSLRVQTLGSHNDDWRRDVRDGALIVSVTYAVEVLKDALVVGAPWLKLPPVVLVGLISTGAHLTLYAIECVGIWLLVKPEPRSMDRKSIAEAAWIRRLYLLGFCASVIYRQILLRYFLLDVSRAWAIGESLLFIVVEVLLNNHLRKLSQRIPDRSLAGKFSVLVWLQPLGTTAGSVIPSLLVYFHLWSTSMTWRFTRSRVQVIVKPASMRVIPFHLVRLAIAAWVAVVIWKFAVALKETRRVQNDDLGLSDR